jgi:hypothetical protein
LITIFVANSDEELLYKSEIPDYKIVVGVPTLVEQRNFITDYYPEGTHLVCCDDDIKKLDMLTRRPLKEIIEQMFELCRFELVNLWGVYPVHTSNNFYLKERVVKGLKYCVGCLCGIINDHKARIPSALKGPKDDKWRTLYFYKRDGAVLRYEGLSIYTNYYGKGGLSEYRTLESEAEETKLVVKEFDDIASYKVKKNGHAEVVFRDSIQKLLYLT